MPYCVMCVEEGKDRIVHVGYVEGTLNRGNVEVAVYLRVPYSTKCTCTQVDSIRENYVTYGS